MPFLIDVASLTTHSDRTWMLTQELRYQGSTEEFVVPVGFVTDLATVPRPVTWLVPTYGKYTLAAILHDWLCTVGIRSGVITSRDADGLFRRVMREEGVPVLRRWIMWAGVRWGAAFKSIRRSGWWADAPMVLALTLFVAPLVIPVTVLVAVGLAVYGLIELAVETAFVKRAS